MAEPYTWSPAMAAIRKAHVLDPVHADPRTDRAANLLLGHPFPQLRSAVLDWGQADFRTPTDRSGRPPLSPADKVLLDCYVNMRKRFFACSAAYAAHGPVIAAALGSATPAAVIDVGCGPGTAGLALADRFPGRRFDYHGIDIAPAMRDKAGELWEAARGAGLVAADAAAEFYPSWEDVRAVMLPPEAPVLVLFAYFFTSKSVGPTAVKSLAEFVRGLAGGRGGEVTVVYVNSAREAPGGNYPTFLRGLGIDPEAFPPAAATIEYRTLGGEPPGKEEFVYDLFHVLGD